MVFDDEEFFDKEKEEVKAIFEDIKHTPSGDGHTLLDTPIDESVFSSELFKSLEAEKQGDYPEKTDNYDVHAVRADHYEAPTGEDSHYEALAGEDDHSEALTVKDGQQFVTIEGFKEDNLGSKFQYNTRTLMLDMPNPSTHSMASHNNNQVGKQASYETCYRLKDKALRGLERRR